MPKWLRKILRNVGYDWGGEAAYDATETWAFPVVKRVARWAWLAVLPLLGGVWVMVQKDAASNPVSFWVSIVAFVGSLLALAVPALALIRLRHSRRATEPAASGAVLTDELKEVRALATKLTASPSSPFATTTAFANARAILDQLFVAAEAGDKGALAELSIAFENARELARQLYGSTNDFFAFFNPALARLRALYGEYGETGPAGDVTATVIPNNPRETATAVALPAGPPAPVSPKQRLATPNHQGLDKDFAQSLIGYGLVQPSMMAIGELLDRGRGLAMQLKMDGSNTGLSIPSPYGASASVLVRTWCAAAESMINRMPEGGQKPIFWPELREGANLWESYQYLRSKISAVEAYLRSI